MAFVYYRTAAEYGETTLATGKRIVQQRARDDVASTSLPGGSERFAPTTVSRNEEREQTTRYSSITCAVALRTFALTVVRRFRGGGVQRSWIVTVETSGGGGGGERGRAGFSCACTGQQARREAFGCERSSLREFHTSADSRLRQRPEKLPRTDAIDPTPNVCDDTSRWRYIFHILDISLWTTGRSVGPSMRPSKRNPRLKPSKCGRISSIEEQVLTAATPGLLPFPAAFPAAASLALAVFATEPPAREGPRSPPSILSASLACLYV